MPNNFVQLGFQALTSGTTTVTFTNLPTTYRDLYIITNTRTNGGGNLQSFFCRVGNGSADSGANYNGQEVIWIPNAGILVAQTTGNTAFQSVTTADGASANYFGQYELYISGYAVSGNAKPAVFDGYSNNNANTIQKRLVGSVWSGTSAINYVQFTNGSGDFYPGSTFSIYGIKNS